MGIKKFLCDHKVHLRTRLVKATFNKARQCVYCDAWIDEAAGERVTKEKEFFYKIYEEALKEAQKRKPQGPMGDPPDAA